MCLKARPVRVCFVFFLLIAVFFFCTVGEENESPAGSGVAVHQKQDRSKILCSHRRASCIWEGKQLRVCQAPALGSKKVATIHPNMPKVRVLTSYPLYCALPVKDQHLPLHLSKEIPFIFTELFSVFFFPGTCGQERRVPASFLHAELAAFGRRSTAAIHDVFMGWGSF